MLERSPGYLSGAPHYFRLQSPRILAEWDNTARNANHAHSVWRDPGADFGVPLDEENSPR
ncbi:DUF3500 domain-containing protein [Amycolatopsis panacis]|uniref:DUF3500 domain-containing protein n=1 Tax=Amycolatopsis panacis TaxID=2340917 RepID=A0A419IAP3_9PSEU|nr:DUF3500 domain-containing protein [Amycolatopsis panacis]RJQ90101.1 DUF3500 domain-containing protein [Amycolatopsis panacis]